MTVKENIFIFVWGPELNHYTCRIINVHTEQTFFRTCL